MTAAGASVPRIEELYWQVMELRSQFPGGRLLPIRPDWREGEPPRGRVAEIFRAQLDGVQTILDVGAGDRYWLGVLRRLGYTGRYASVDVETRHRHEHRDFIEVDEAVDAVFMLELLEHLPGPLGLEYLDHASRLIKPGGVLVIGTPNPRHAHQVWSADFTHVRPWPAHDVWAVCRVLGFSEVTVYRQMLVPARRRLLVPLQLALSKVLELDPAYGLLVFARR
jgi:SAM-dependent methyltransferase